LYIEWTRCHGPRTKVYVVFRDAERLAELAEEGDDL
jgi:hypothetical protein